MTLKGNLFLHFIKANRFKLMVKRTFSPGTEWLYLKIYTGIKTADIILSESVEPTTALLLRNNYISKWFFIRYNDPKSHLRLRLQLTDIKHYDQVIKYLSDSLQEFVESGEISNITIDTYSREIERYGAETIKAAEEIFHINSKLVTSCLHLSDEKKIIISIFFIDKILTLIGFNSMQKHGWIKDFNNSFKYEFNADKKLNSQLDKKYRTFIPKYTEFLSSKYFLEERNNIIASINEINPSLKSVIKSEKNSSNKKFLQSFFQSIFHMNINRHFISNQRLFEMVIYDYLNRYYKTEIYQISKKSFKI